MSHIQPLIAVEPENELRFKGPFNDPSTATMVISNKTEKRVCFKVKTTAKVKTGVLEANSSVTILVSLQPFDIKDPAARGRVDTFQVLSVAVPEGMINLDNVWKEVAPEDIHVWKLKCILDLPPMTDAELSKWLNEAAREMIENLKIVSDTTKNFTEGIQLCNCKEKEENWKRELNRFVNGDQSIFQPFPTYYSNPVFTIVVVLIGVFIGYIVAKNVA
ncbi:vesicle-associated membrane protein-associated protein B/C-like isoform X2 [Artemia franciscana]|uniref:vesicle-associated membrane protein-associated protein B/C-like isoform X2 n=1 Tax=Artemia franciscana TaxID=6661 RepID=UPI0032D9C111